MYYSVIRRGGTASTLWAPSELSSLRAWYDVSAETGYADGDAITSLTDQSGNGITVTGTGAYNTNVQNGLPVVTQSGDFVSSSVSDFDGHTRAIWIMVVKDLLNLSVSNSGTSFLLVQDIGTKHRVLMDMGTGANSGKGATVDPTGFHLAAALSDDDSGTNSLCKAALRVDGTEYRGNFNNSNVGFLTTGHVVTFSGSASQQVCEAVLVSDAASFEWTDDEPEKLEGYLAHKWGLTANLPVGHPYKSLAPTV